MKRTYLILGVVGAAIGTAGLASLTSFTEAQTTTATNEAVPSVAQYTVSFANAQPEGRLKSLLEQNGLKPFAVFMRLDDQYGRHSVAASAASVTVIDDARRITSTMESNYGKSLQRRSALIAEGKLPAEAKDRIAAAEAKRSSRAQALGRGQPIIYGLWVTGDAEGIAALTKTAGISTTPAQTVQGRTVLLDPKAP